MKGLVRTAECFRMICETCPGCQVGCLILHRRPSQPANNPEDCALPPDRPFHNFIASRLGDRTILRNSRTILDGFPTPKLRQGWSGSFSHFSSACVIVSLVVIKSSSSNSKPDNQSNWTGDNSHTTIELGEISLRFR